MNGPEVEPDFGAVSQAGGLGHAIGALMTFVLVLAVLMLIISAIAWAIASAIGNYQGAARARAGLWVAVAASVICGGGIAWLNFLITTGHSL
ncbi:DUF6112 family protein [Leucobacter sp. UCD-THU]|uniref:DUF6112 family protein n=1 Tax=Leucobacter sp. UCD-THU TaxID=1292023 RepID=UPI00039B0BB4|nr:DUF6112 family protein [Leucobacter sp. UCD-THU]